MFNRTTYSPTHNNNLNINAVSGMLVKNHPKSFMIRINLNDRKSDTLFSHKPKWDVWYGDGKYDYKEEDVVILQTLLCGNNMVMCEIVPKKDWVEGIIAE